MEAKSIVDMSAVEIPREENIAAGTPTLLPADADRLGDEIALLSAHLDAATHRLLTLIREFDAGSGWYTHGALSCAAWLSWRIGLDLCAAREKVRVARALGALPRIDGAFRRGQVSYSKVRALTRVATAENEGALLEMARSATASQLERICRGYRRALNGILGKVPCDDESERWVRDRSTEGGMIRIEAQLPPEEAAVVLKAIERARELAWRAERTSAETSPTPPDASARRDERRKLGRADALVALAEDYLASSAPAGGPPVEVVVHVEADALARAASAEAGTLDDGTSLPPATVERLACDAAVVTIVEDRRGVPLDVGRRRRTIPAALRRALRLRDRGCVYPGCENRRVDGHHVTAWSRGGPTNLGNLASLCRRHHRYVHELGFRIEPREDGRFAFFAPAGWEVKPSWTPPPVAGDAVAMLIEHNSAAGLAIDVWTSLPRWDGTPPDYDHIVHTIATNHPPRLQREDGPGSLPSAQRSLSRSRQLPIGNDVGCSGNHKNRVVVRDFRDH
jgi:hypothetical protein